MATRNPWSINDPNKIAQVGAQALASGKVSPAQAMANYKLVIGEDPTDNDPFSMSAPQDLYGEVSGLGNQKGAKAEIKRQMDMKRSSSTTRYNSKSADQSRFEKLASQGIYPNQTGTDSAGNPTYDFENLPEPDANDPYQEQKKGLDRTRELLALQSKSDSSWLQPLAALADARAAETGRKSDLSSGFEAPAASQARFMKSAEELQKRQGDLTKESLANQKLMKGGTTTEGLTQALMASVMAGQNNQNQERNNAADERIHDRVLARLQTNKNLQTKLAQYQNLQGALANLSQADVKNPNSFEELQQAVRSNLGIKGTSGVSERERTYLNSLGLASDRIAQIVSGKPSEMGESGQAFMKHVIQLANIETNNVKQQYGRGLRAVTAGHESFYNDRPKLKKDLENSISAYSGQLNDYAPMAKEEPAKAPAAAASSGLPPMDAIDAELAKRGVK